MNRLKLYFLALFSLPVAAYAHNPGGALLGVFAAGGLSVVFATFGTILLQMWESKMQDFAYKRAGLLWLCLLFGFLILIGPLVIALLYVLLGG